MIKDFVNQFLRLKFLLEKLEEKNYNYKDSQLDNATIGCHVRHILEFVHCLSSQYESAEIDYESRARNIQIELDKNFAIQMLDNLLVDIDKHDKILSLVARNRHGEVFCCNTTYYRELFYNIEHCIHHEALIKISLKNQNIVHLVDQEFGYAPSTIRARVQNDSF